MKKTLTMILAVAMLCTIITGCDGNKDVSDTVKWMNTTYAILTSGNKGDFEQIGGFEKTAANKIVVQQLLKDSWEVTDRKTADANIDWLLEEGHRTDFVKEMKELKDSGALDVSKADMTEQLVSQGVLEDQQSFYFEITDIYKDKGDKAIDAWDYSRVLQLLGYYYVADLYTEKEAMDKSLEVAKIIQKEFTSWDEFVSSYLAGYQYWKSESSSAASYEQRVDIYEKLKADEKNPYAIAWDTKLEKTWKD